MAAIPREAEAISGARIETVARLAGAIEAKVPFMRGHAEEVSDLAAAVAEKLGLDDDSHDRLVLGSLLHDVGKLAIDQRILLKPAGLTALERSVVEEHPAIGSCIVEQVPGLAAIAPAVRHHHERWDGEGYPDGLSGEEIPLAARIIAVADSFSAMTANRPYCGRKTVDQARAELERCAGTQFDPEVVSVFCEELTTAFAA
jgi:HD-GYP domain-containing protein (c-di-GMP phosphodiesterase class II)